jgi:hypothetical protein
MKPDPKRFLEVAAAHLTMSVAPALGRGYGQSNALVLAGMLLSLGEELDRAAARRVEENRALRAIFAAAAPVVVDGVLREKLVAAAAGEEADFRISTLEASNAAMRGLLIELHAAVEALEGAAARRIEEEIWRELVVSTERRRLAMQPF